MLFTFGKSGKVDDIFNLIEYTNRSIFLTGRAGTGKTTFLRSFIQKTKKKFVIVAPTGIAAINAGGVTIHSMFGLPLTTFAPTLDFIDRNEAINIQQLLPHFKYRRDKLKLLRTLDILIIDEVSMMRCDVVDMVDLALRSARKSQQPFGGVQLLLIGDLYQLPPVVKEVTERILYQYYASPFFFAAKSLEALQLLTITLQKVYRQTDERFLQLLNAIRNRDLDAIDFEWLHARYDPLFEQGNTYIHLVSHNYIANNINNQRLREIKEPAYTYNAIVTGDFKETLYPNDAILELKKGTRVMFMRNDSSEEKKYYNGLLATISELDEETIKVLPDDGSGELEVTRETWENKRYYVDQERNIKEDIIGRYEQYPIKLAWAVTIHKSQGLTFDKVVIDAGRSFTSGQVYVALSRCRTMEGIVLKSRITADAVLVDERIADFHHKTNAGENTAHILEEEKYKYALDRVLRTIDLSRFLDDIASCVEAAAESRFLDEEEQDEITGQIIQETEELIAVYQKFASLVSSKLSSSTETDNQWDYICERCRGAVNFFYDKVGHTVFLPLKKIYTSNKGSKGLKGFNEKLRPVLQDLEDYLASLKTVHLLEEPLYKESPKDATKVKVTKTPTHVLSYQLFEKGLSPQEISAQRGLTVGTVLSHLGKMAEVGVLDVERLFSADRLVKFEEIFDAHDFHRLTEWKSVLPDWEFNEIRVLLAHYRYKSGKRDVVNDND
ncbi:MAG: helix-turn-helix domain-containing protein [Niabella sp.]